jgi:hypothetical protein
MFDRAPQLVERRFPFQYRRLGQADETVRIIFLDRGKIIVYKSGTLPKVPTIREDKKDPKRPHRLRPYLVTASLNHKDADVSSSPEHLLP